MAFGMKYWLIESELEQMSTYLDTMRTSLEEQLRKFEVSIDEMTNNMSDEEKEEFYEYHSNGYWELKDLFPGQLYSSFVISWYSFVEHQLIRLCESLHLTITVAIQENKDLGKGIRRARTFLIEGKDYTLDNGHWQELVSIGQVRNRLVHGDNKFHIILGQPTDPNTKAVPVTVSGETYYVRIDQAFYEYLSRNGIFAFESIPSIKATFDYCQHLVTFGRAFFSKIYQDLGLN